MRTETMESQSWLAENWETLTTAVLGAGTTVGAWIQGQKSAKSQEIDDAGKLIDQWEKLSNKFETRVGELESKHDECEQSKHALSCKVNDLEGSISLLRRETEDCDRRYQILNEELGVWKEYVGNHIGFPPKPKRNGN